MNRLNLARTITPARARRKWLKKVRRHIQRPAPTTYRQATDEEVTSRGIGPHLVSRNGTIYQQDQRGVVYKIADIDSLRKRQALAQEKSLADVPGETK